MDFEINKVHERGEITMSEEERELLTNRLIVFLINKASTEGSEVLTPIESALYHVLLDTDERRRIISFAASSRYLNILRNVLVGVNEAEDLETSSVAAVLTTQLDGAIVELRAFEAQQEAEGIIDSFEVPDTIDELNT